MDAINDYLKRTNKTFDIGLYPLVHCKDGFTISVQASRHHYCTPRIDGADKYDAVELGFPSNEDSLITEYAEDPDTPTDSVYGYVPVEIVNKLIEKHGGIIYEEES